MTPDRLLLTLLPSLMGLACQQETIAQTRTPGTPPNPSASSGVSSDPAPGSVVIQKVPFVRQKPDFCGEACVEMALRRLGHRVSQDDFFTISGVDPLLGRGVVTRELVSGLKRLGFEPGKVWYDIPRGRSHLARSRALEAQFTQLHRDLRASVPSIICTHYDSSPNTTQHFRLVLGYDVKRDEVIYHEPAVDGGSYRRMARREMLALWPLPYRPDHDVLIRIPLKYTRLQIPRLPRVDHTTADYVQHVMQLQPTLRRLRGRFPMVIEPPFVVTGTVSLRDIRAQSRGLIRWSVAELKRRYFTRDPAQIVTIYLFGDRQSYEVNARRLTGQPAGTPFGFYSPSHHALIMNISTGGGTLVHEIVHPFMEANFPHCPPWFNEGMGSLYEGVGRRNHQIWGYLNWRLPGLQQAIRRRAVPAFAHLMRMNETRFYDQDCGTNYAQSRYLLYYLQDKGLLQTYYHAFVKNHAKDPTGYQTLKQVLGEPGRDMTAFQHGWEQYVLGLKRTRPPVK